MYQPHFTQEETSPERSGNLLVGSNSTLISPTADDRLVFSLGMGLGCLQTYRLSTEGLFNPSIRDKAR